MTGLPPGIHRLVHEVPHICRGKPLRVPSLSDPNPDSAERGAAECLYQLRAVPIGQG